MKLLDTVALLVDANGRSMDDKDVRLLCGQVGTVVEDADADADADYVIVEFADVNGVAYGLASVARSSLLRLHHDRPKEELNKSA